MGAVTACPQKTTLLLHTKLHAFTAHTPNPPLESSSGEGTRNLPRSDCSLSGNPKCLDTLLDFSSLTSSTFVVLDLIFNM
ncbi:hypothetical protein E2C01_035358 [Portunus trituberculatus]|uniref:Uncharacterized protein n=1 Tax=Portunus trituberculatus TaxID=210409 RepID=A0A5B7F850_PORTR|nr:hypothetical protein [Portunus trituberculatus]